MDVNIIKSFIVASLKSKGYLNEEWKIETAKVFSMNIDDLYKLVKEVEGSVDIQKPYEEFISINLSEIKDLRQLWLEGKDQDEVDYKISLFLDKYGR